MSGYGRQKLPRELERLFWRKVSVGLTTEDATIAVGVSKSAGVKWFNNGGGISTLSLAEPSGRYLSKIEREDIAPARLFTIEGVVGV